MPWADRAPAHAVPLQTAPASPTLGDLGFGASRGAPAQWMNDTFNRHREAIPGVKEGESVAMDYEMQVFISAGMPEGVLRHLFAQAMQFPQGKVRFVVRGFTPQQLGPLVSKLRGLFPDPYSDHIALEVDPNAFRTYKVEAVPVFLVKEQYKWFEVQGAQSLDAAKENVRSRSRKVVGELYAIAEPDILAVIEERAKKFDWAPVLARAQTRMANNLKPGFDLPTANRSDVRYHTPTFSVPHDITAPGQDGQAETVLAQGGQTLNLLDHTRLQVPVIVFDASDTRQVKMVRGWLQRPEFKDADLFVIGSELAPRNSRLPITTELGNAFKRPVYPWLAKLSERMGVDSVPSIVTQDGKRLRISSFDPENR
ncbi:TrbC family F-type conjugative pilus assembly protein [Acidovorax sp. sic0104]|uniref:TrbC family F-type conjugative pilus assembly protein n=1 Tax=Acidovorax sp. sic0104 TaxID=2854784 RepID=UPI00210296E1|nr:TrbC family F-type conjugative pilus assembly protein [Acidovorax sp. sic0104]